jgi:phenylalanyl-tRNA synthetase alpha chain
MSVQELKDKLEKVESEALTALQSADTAQSLEEIRLNYLGQKGHLTLVLRGLSQLTKEERPAVGQLANTVKERIQAVLDERKHSLHSRELEQRLAGESIDVTLPGSGQRLGHIHPLTQISEEIITIFYGMGFEVAEGPEVETEYYNFDALNTPPDHPARDEQDTFYTNLGSCSLLRSQTSTVQIRVMEKRKPPLRVISPGRVYRNEEINARKYPLFHQVEGLLIDRDVTFGQLKGTLNEFIRLLFGKPLNTRFRPDFFPFTEPSAELDSQCPFCMGAGCRTCGHRGWLELLGCGMVDPNVLQGVGIDPEQWSGFAFGMGIERLAMLKYGVNDIRHFYSSDLRFLEQF